MTSDIGKLEPTPAVLSSVSLDVEASTESFIQQVAKHQNMEKPERKEIFFSKERLLELQGRPAFVLE